MGAGRIVFATATSIRGEEIRHAFRQSKISYRQELECLGGGACESLKLLFDTLSRKWGAASPEDFLAGIIRVHSEIFVFIRKFVVQIFSPSVSPRLRESLPFSSAPIETPLQHCAWHKVCSASHIPSILPPIILPKNPISSFPF
jgi:hypothetical protein